MGLFRLFTSSSRGFDLDLGWPPLPPLWLAAGAFLLPDLGFVKAFPLELGLVNLFEEADVLANFPLGPDDDPPPPGADLLLPYCFDDMLVTFNADRSIAF